LAHCAEIPCLAQLDLLLTPTLFNPFSPRGISKKL
jgi:hypothetical protein